MNTRFLITGASGYIGYHLAKRAAGLGHEVSALGRMGSQFRDLESHGVRLFRTDGGFAAIKKAVVDSKASCIFHLAGESKGSHEPTDIPSLIESNITFGTLLIEAAIDAGCTRLISAGSYWEFGEKVPTSNGVSGNQDVSRFPTTLYSACKAAFAQIAQYASHYRGLEWKQLVLYDVYGPDDWREKLMPRLVKQAFMLRDQSGTQDVVPVGLSPGEQLIDYVHVEDVVDAFLHAAHLMQEDIKFPTVCGVHSQHLMTLRTAVELLEQSLNVKLRTHWGKFPYLKTQIFNPYIVPVLPGWKAKKVFPDGITDQDRSLGHLQQ